MHYKVTNAIPNFNELYFLYKSDEFNHSGTQFEKTIGEPIFYNGKAYRICEPTPQKKNLNIGQLSENLKIQNYQVVYAYMPPSSK